jgi:membrane fusion protein, hemolysin D
VKKGQLLIELDSSLATAEEKSAQKALTTARLERDIMKKTLVGEDITGLVAQADISEDTKQDLLQLASSKGSASEVKRRLLVSNISQAGTQLSSEQQSQRTLEDNIKKGHAREQELRTQAAQSSGQQQAAYQAQLDEQTRQTQALENTLASQKQRVSQAQSSVDQANGSLNSFNAEDTSTTATTIVDQDKTIAGLEDALNRAKKTIEQLSIKAPVDGTVLSLASKTIGGVVTVAQPLVVIVPDNTPLIVEASLENKDVGFVSVGQKVAVKVDTYSFQRYGYLTGTVKSVSPDAIDDEKKGSIYKMKVTLDTTKTSKDNSIDVSPGMSVTSEITTGNRRIIEFFLDPLVTHTDNSLKQR